MTHKSNFNYLFLISLLFIGCKTTGIVNTNVNLPVRSSLYLVDQLEKNLPSITWLDGSAQVSLLIEGRTQKFSSQIRMKRDSAFVANGKKWSTEGGRIQITRDSFYLLNRTQRTIEIKTYEKVTDAYAIPLGFDELMNVLLGLPVKPIESKYFSASIDKAQYLLKGRHDNLEVVYAINGTTYVLDAIQIKDLRNMRTCQVNLEEYRSFNDHRLAGLRTFTFDNGRGQEISMKVDFSKIELNVPKTIKFNIPSTFIVLD